MSVAIKELLRQPRRFMPVWFALTLLVVLLVILGGFLDGLSRSQTGPYRSYDGDVMVFDKDAGLQLQRSEVAGDALDGADLGGGKVGTLDATFTVAAVGQGADSSDVNSDQLSDVVLYGYSLENQRLPEPPADGEVIVDKQLQRERKFNEGDTIKIGPADEPMKVTKIVDDLSAGAPTVWVNPDEWRRLVGTINPAALPPDGNHQALVVAPASGASAQDLVNKINNAKSDGGGKLEAATIAETIGAMAVVQQQSSTFEAIIAVTFVVSLLVVALFFALITLEQARLYAVLKALGARTSELLRGISTQAFLVTVAALVVGIAVSAVIVAIVPPNLPLRVLPMRIVQISIGLLITAVVGALLTARRLVRIDPATAIG